MIGEVQERHMAGIGGRFVGKTVLITGGSGGLGQSFARYFISEGARVVIGDINAAPGEALADELGDAAAMFVSLDVTSEDSWADAVQAAEQAFGPVTTLINNAGVNDSGSIEEMDASGFRRVIDINLAGAYIGTRAVLASMKKSGSGSIINISSVAGLSPAVGYGAYTASKYALVGLTKVSALELAPYKIRVNSVHPGLIDTSMNPDASSYQMEGQPVPRLGQPSDVSRMVLFLASEEASFCTGSTYVVDGGYLTMVGKFGQINPS